MIRNIFKLIGYILAAVFTGIKIVIDIALVIIVIIAILILLG